MESKNSNSMVQFKNIVRIALVVAVLLLLPLLAMLITDEVRWGVFDFVVAGALLFATGLAYELISRRAGASIAYRVAVGAALATALFLVWTNIAVGIIGSEDNPINLMVYGVLTVFMIGALSVKFSPQGMVRVLLATALAQGLFAAIAMILVNFQDVVEILMVNGFFVVLWVGSGLLFRWANAAQNRQPE
jgi:hypothetical protein